MIFDIHTHVLQKVDDGAKNLEEAIFIVKDLISQGVKKVLLTPHNIPQKYTSSTEELKSQFELLKEEINKQNLDISIYLGQEIYYTKLTLKKLEEKELLSLNNTNYVLIEFSYYNEPNIEEILYEFKLKNYKIILAHIERYRYLQDIQKIIHLKLSGLLIQVNSSTICDKKKRKFIFKLIKNNLIDFIASDVHYFRKASLNEAYKIIEKKFGKETAEYLFYKNQQILFND